MNQPTDIQINFITENKYRFSLQKMMHFLSLPYEQVYPYYTPLRKKEFKVYESVVLPDVKLKYVRPRAEYTNTPSHYGIVDELMGKVLVGRRERNGINSTYKL